MLMIRRISRNTAVGLLSQRSRNIELLLIRIKIVAVSKLFLINLLLFLLYLLSLKHDELLLLLAKQLELLLSI